MALDEATVDGWLRRYVEAWRSNAPDDIRSLFTNYATYRYKPWGAPLVGAEAIVADWLHAPDEPGSWEASYKCDMISGDRAIAIGKTTYVDGGTYANLFQLRFESGRCSEFIDWYMDQSATDTDTP